jgi:hypothetical protein
VSRVSFGGDRTNPSTVVGVLHGEPVWGSISPSYSHGPEVEHALPGAPRVAGLAVSCPRRLQ